MKNNGALVVLSGGQDSMTCLGVALDAGHGFVEAVAFDYGQKHVVELKAAEAVCTKHGVQLTTINLKPVLGFMHSSALITHGDTTKAHPLLEGLPASFVPARNALFLTVAFGLAIEKEIGTIYTGVCETDSSGYPDCRADFIVKLNDALRIGYQADINIETPLMNLNKAETFELARQVGILRDVIELSVTCYDGHTDTMHGWGVGCGECPACKLRARGWEGYVASPYTE